MFPSRHHTNNGCDKSKHPIQQPMHSLFDSLFAPHPHQFRGRLHQHHHRHRNGETTQLIQPTEPNSEVKVDQPSPSVEAPIITCQTPPSTPVSDIIPENGINITRLVNIEQLPDGTIILHPTTPADVAHSEKDRKKAAKRAIIEERRQAFIARRQEVENGRLLAKADKLSQRSQRLSAEAQELLSQANQLNLQQQQGENGQPSKPIQHDQYYIHPNRGPFHHHHHGHPHRNHHHGCHHHGFRRHPFHHADTFDSSDSSSSSSSSSSDEPVQSNQQNQFQNLPDLFQGIFGLFQPPKSKKSNQDGEQKKEHPLEKHLKVLAEILSPFGDLEVHFDDGASTKEETNPPKESTQNETPSALPGASDSTEQQPSLATVPDADETKSTENAATATKPADFNDFFSLLFEQFQEFQPFLQTIHPLFAQQQPQTTTPEQDETQADNTTTITTTITTTTTPTEVQLDTESIIEPESVIQSEDIIDTSPIEPHVEEPSDHEYPIIEIATDSDDDDFENITFVSEVEDETPAQPIVDPIIHEPNDDSKPLIEDVTDSNPPSPLFFPQQQRFFFPGLPDEVATDVPLVETQFSTQIQEQSEEQIVNEETPQDSIIQNNYFSLPGLPDEVAIVATIEEIAPVTEATIQDKPDAETQVETQVEIQVPSSSTQTLLQHLISQNEKLYNSRTTLVNRIKANQHNPGKLLFLEQNLKGIDLLISQTHKFTEELLDNMDVAGSDDDEFQFLEADE